MSLEIKLKEKQMYFELFFLIYFSYTMSNFDPRKRYMQKHVVTIVFALFFQVKDIAKFYKSKLLQKSVLKSMKFYKFFSKKR